MQSSLSPPRDGGSLLQGSAQRMAIDTNSTLTNFNPALTRNGWSNQKEKMHAAFVFVGRFATVRVRDDVSRFLNRTYCAFCQH